VLSAVDTAFGFPERPDFLRPVRLDIRAGECWGIIGPNGAGKSTLLRLLASLHSPASGTVLLHGDDLESVPARRRAQTMAYLPQHLPRDLPTSALDVVLMGRYPHRPLGLFESPEDFEVARRVMTLLGVAGLVDRPLASLSGGEAQRVHLAAALAQEPRLLLLDEPTAALDLHHELDIFRLLRQLADRERLAIVIVTHDVNLARRCCTHALLLDDGRTVAAGPPAEVITPARLGPVYGVRLEQARLEGDAGGWIVPRPGREEAP
jgi:iron complex transport system ATP-binding protein